MSVEAPEIEVDDNADLLGAQLNDADNQYLTFMMAGEEYGVDILSVQEIRGWEAATPIPNAPPNVKGVINLRGNIIPLIDLRQCFGLDSITYTPVTVVIVLKVTTGKVPRIMGIIVDAVSDVYTITEKEMRVPPDLGDSVDTGFIRGLSTVNDKMIVLLEMDKLLSLEDVSNLSEIVNKLAG